MSKSSSIVIIGSGAFGLSAAYHLSEAGYSNITVLDEGDYDNNHFNPLLGATAASTDFNKLVRASYVDKVHYQNLALEAIAKYYEWNKQLKRAPFLPQGLTNEDVVFRNTGYLRFDDIDTGEEERTLAHFEKQGLRSYVYDINNPEDVKRSKITGWYEKIDPLNQRGVVNTLNGVLDTIAGVSNANKSLLWVKYLSERSGNVHFVYGPKKGHAIRILKEGSKATAVETEDGTLHKADYVVIAAGAGSTRFLDHSQRRVEAQGSSFIMIQIPKDRRDLIEKYQNFPQVNWKMSYEGHFRKEGIYLFPATDDGILKIGANDHFWRHLEKNEEGELTSIPTQKYQVLPEESLQTYKDFVSTWLKDLTDAGIEISKSRLCFDARGQRNEFVIDFVPGLKNVILSTGGAFHGFKFLPVIGRFVEGLVSGKHYEYSEKFRFESIPETDYSNDFVFNLDDPHALNGIKLAQKSEYFNL